MFKLKKSNDQLEPRKVILFSGHMIDKSDRKIPRFPPEIEPAVTREISKKLNTLNTGSQDLALCGGACGGDLIFAELCLKRNAHLEIRIPFNEPEFLIKSVNFAGSKWQSRFYRVKENPNTKLLVMPNEITHIQQEVNPYEQNNIWQLERTFTWNTKKVNFICLWDRKTGDGPGGTKHMYDEVQKRNGNVLVIDINLFMGRT